MRTSAICFRWGGPKPALLPAMILRLICPTGHVLDVDAQLAGRKIRCGACGRIMLVPPPGGREKPAAKPAGKPLPPAKPPAAKLPVAKLPEKRPAIAPLVQPPAAEPLIQAAAARQTVHLPPVMSEPAAAEFWRSRPLHRQRRRSHFRRPWVHGARENRNRPLKYLPRGSWRRRLRRSRRSNCHRPQRKWQRQIYWRKRRSNCRR